MQGRSVILKVYTQKENLSAKVLQTVRIWGHAPPENLKSGVSEVPFPVISD